ncbi:MAG TPA: flagellar export chaperone FlgN [Polyangia bacterium]
MDPLEHALDVATRMRQTLQAELDEAREQRVLVRKLDVQGLFERARRRGEFNVKLSQMQDALGVALIATASVLGVDRVSLDILRTSGIYAASKVAQALSELRATAQALQEIDALNQVLAKRALACVRGYISALSPRADVYDRYGGVREDNVGSIARQVA